MSEKLKMIMRTLWTTLVCNSTFLCIQFPTGTAPTSFEGTYGRIIYRVRAFIDTPRFSKDYNIEKPFYLLSLLNLNELTDIWVRHHYMCVQFGWSLFRFTHSSDGLRRSNHTLKHGVLFIYIKANGKTASLSICPSRPSGCYL